MRLKVYKFHQMPNPNKHKKLLVLQKVETRSAAFVAPSLILSRSAPAVARPNTVEKAARQTTGKNIK